MVIALNPPRPLHLYYDTTLGHQFLQQLQRWVMFFVLYLFLVVGDDAADEVRVGVPERGHEVTQLLLVQLAHSAEHALTCFERTVHGVRHSCHLIQADDAVHWEDTEKMDQSIIVSVCFMTLKSNLSLFLIMKTCLWVIHFRLFWFWRNTVTPLTVSPQVSSKFVSRLVEQSGHTLVQRIHVFHQPLVCFVVHLHHTRAT